MRRTRTRLHYENAHDPAGVATRGRGEVPVGCAAFPREITRPPRSWAQPHYAIARWTEMPRGGHFAPLEQPALLMDDVRAFFAPLRVNDPGTRASAAPSR